MSEELQKDLYMLQRHQEQIEDIYGQIELIERLIEEYEKVVSTLIEMQKLEGEKDALMPVGANIFLYSTIKDTSKVLARIGSKVYVEKSVTKAIEFVNKKIEDLKRNEESLVKTAREIKQRMDEISKRLRDKNVQVSEEKD
ncbi:MAG: prefoldin subunit alpha [Thermoplasmata archaeon]|nr:MAG: prefoldin subunit alpha [Thermoplasmata archaeon]MCD6222476.1 prefoldin subunit alpha [Thermoplasmata archaeon]